jgi:hypothetical protein
MEAFHEPGSRINQEDDMNLETDELKLTISSYVCKECGREETREQQDERSCCGQQMVRA